MNAMRFFAVREPWRQAIALHVRVKNAAGAVAFLKDLIVETLPDDHDFAQIQDAPIYLNDDAAQSLMDELWNCGVRPRDGSGSNATAMEAQAHIKDLQQFALRLLSIVEIVAERPPQ